MDIDEPQMYLGQYKITSENGQWSGLRKICVPPSLDSKTRHYISSAAYCASIFHHGTATKRPHHVQQPEHTLPCHGRILNAHNGIPPYILVQPWIVNPRNRYGGLQSMVQLKNHNTACSNSCDNTLTVTCYREVYGNIAHEENGWLGRSKFLYNASNFWTKQF